MEHRTDAELARLAYGRASTARERQRAQDAALELDRRRRARAEVDAGAGADLHPEDAGADPAGTDLGASEPAGSQPGASEPAADDPDADDPATAVTPAAAPAAARPRRRALVMVVIVALSLVAIGIVAQVLTPRSSLEIFDRPASEAERALELQLDSFDPAAEVRIVGSVDDARFFATLTSSTAPATEPLVCIGVSEFGALTIIECLPVAEFEAQGVDTAIPLSAETGGLRIGDGYRYRWGPTGDFQVERVPASE